MLRKTKDNLIDALRYPFLDLKIVLIIGIILFAISILNKLSFSDCVERSIVLGISSLLLLLEMGYGFRIIYKGLIGENKPPKFNEILKLIWNGFKNYCVYILYAIIMSFLYKHAESSFFANNYPLAIICFILFIFVYVLLIGSLLNMCENRGRFVKAFKYNEIYDLLKDIGAIDTFTILISLLIAQTFAISCFVDIHPNTLSLLEVIYSILTFFLAPITLISTKRLISLNLRRVYSEKERVIEKEV